MLTVTLIGCASARLNLIDAERLAVDGITVYASRSAVLQRLGEPHARETGFDDSQDMGGWETLTWPGLVVEVIQPDPPKEFHVARVVITGRSWQTACGLRVGDSAADVRRLLGPPERMDTGDNGPFWYYLTAGFDGGVVVTFRDERVIEIRIEEDWT